MTAITETAAPAADAAMTPDAFMAALRRLLKARRAADVVATFERHGPEILDRLSESQRLRLDAIMDWADTVTECLPETGSPQERRK